MRYRLVLTLLSLALMAISGGYAYVHWSKGGTGTGIYSRHWSPDPVQGYWDPGNFYRSPNSVQGVFEGKLCIQCHEGITPGIVADWQASRHAQGEAPVYCSDCHGNDHQQLRMPTPDVCGGCHEKQHGEFKDEARFGFPSHVLAMERAVDAPHFADKPKAEVQSCVQCHSVATKCDSCHTRHRFNAAEARRPEACITCHSGPPHPDDESYFGSAHGKLYLAEGNDWDWSIYRLQQGAQLMRKAVSFRIRIIGLLPGIFCLATHSVLADETVPPGPFTQTECITCHTDRNPELIRQWREGPHSTASAVNCSSCHGDRHKDSGIRARKDQGCTGCHEGPASHSYATSKHGVITRLEENGQDWRKPLQRGNYRTPGCSYCHLHDGDHGDSMAPARGPAVRQWICAGCHSPRYVREQFASGKRQLDIADLKLTEGETLISSAVEPKPDVLPKLRRDLIHHRQNVLLGVGHQSPDYQWWHGQPALDGDIIQIRDALTMKKR